MYKKILIGIDLVDDMSPCNALTTALDLCRTYEAELHILTVVPDLPIGIIDMYLFEDTGRKLVSNAKQRLERFALEHVPKGVALHCHVATGAAYREMLEKAREIAADLIVIGCHRPGMSDFLIGPNASRVVRHAKVSVLVVR